MGRQAWASEGCRPRRFGGTEPPRGCHCINMRNELVVVVGFVAGCGGAVATGVSGSGGAASGGRTSAGGATSGHSSVVSASYGGVAGGQPGTVGSHVPTGGNSPKGGSTATGGSSPNSGSTTTGGISPIGGASASGGASATGGISGGGSASSGGNVAGGSTQVGRINPCSLPRAYCATGPEPWQACGQRGGACVMMSSASIKCPDGTYNPFADGYCPTGAISRCCVPIGDLGSPCDASNPCDGNGCLPEMSHYPLGGVCASACSRDDCPASGVCVAVPWSQAPGMCLLACTNDRDCRAGQSCQAFPSGTSVGAIGRYACWAPGRPEGKGLGDLCSRDIDCLSTQCRPDSTGINRCSARCNATYPCLTGFKCQTDPTCSSMDCGLCFPG